MSQQYQPRGGGHRGGQGGPRPAGGGGSSGGGPGGFGRDENDDIKAALQSNATVSYRDGKDLRPALLDKEAQAAAKALDQITPTQLRRFFEQVVTIKRRIDIDRNLAESVVLSEVAFLKGKAAYAAARSKRNDKRVAMVDFIVKHANSIKRREDFLDFHRHFEAVVAFHKVYRSESD